MKIEFKDISIPKEEMELKVNRYFEGATFDTLEELFEVVENYINELVSSMVEIRGVVIEEPKKRLKSVHVDSLALNEHLRNSLIDEEFESFEELEKAIGKVVRDSVEEFTHFSVK